MEFKLMTELLSTDQAFIRKLTDIVLANLQNENFGIKELARESGLSGYSLTTKKTIGALIKKSEEY